MHNDYERLKAIQAYHSAVAQLMWAIEHAVLESYDWHYSEWDSDYVVQCVRDVLHSHVALLATHVS